MGRKRNRSSSGSSSDSDSSKEEDSRRRGGKSGDREEDAGKGRERDRDVRNEGRDRDNRDRREDDQDRRRDPKEGANGEGGSADPKGGDQKLSLMERTIKMGKAGGAYIPPFRLKQMMQEAQDKSSAEYQRMTWEGLKKSINGLVNKVTKTNITSIVQELFSQNLVRARGLYARSVMKAQLASPAFSSVREREREREREEKEAAQTTCIGTKQKNTQHHVMCALMEQP
jgi:pre-mRNA-splicing factor CWC22